MFSQNLRAARLAAGLSQKELADKIFISQQAYAKYELGISSPNPDTIRLISQELDIPSDVLIGTAWNSFVKNHQTAHAMIANNKANFSKHAKLDKNYLCIVNRAGEYIEYQLTDGQLDVLERMLAQMPGTTTDSSPYGEIAAEGGELNSHKKKPETTL